uniref:Uncharacterized protein n=1 Tax=Kalanchoe fedtschenkoi TaxID=63787 RepID=A0A7N0V8M6_KALFE
MGNGRPSSRSPLSLLDSPLPKIFIFSSFNQSANTMNEKSSVSKELNAKHAKILECLLRLPENRECADCGRK